MCFQAQQTRCSAGAFAGVCFAAEGRRDQFWRPPTMEFDDLSNAEKRQFDVILNILKHIESS